jgi:hypothetical protein
MWAPATDWACRHRFVGSPGDDWIAGLSGWNRIAERNGRPSRVAGGVR